MDRKVGFSISARPGRKRDAALRALSDDEDEEEGVRVESVEEMNTETESERRVKKLAPIPLLGIEGTSAYRERVKSIADEAEQRRKEPSKAPSNIASIVKEETEREKARAEEIEKSSQLPAPKVFGLGLQVRDRSNKSQKMDVEGMSDALDSMDNATKAALPILLRNQHPELVGIADEEERYRTDVALRPDAPTFDTYATTSIESYGERLLAGMGWTEGGAIGLTNRQCVKPILYVPRPDRIGLGASESSIRNKKQAKRYIKPGEKRDDGEMMVAAPGEDGRKRHYRTVDEDLVRASDVQYDAPRVGAFVSVIAGMHEGAYAKVERARKGVVTLRFPSEEVDDVSPSDVTIVKTSELPEGHAALRALAVFGGHSGSSGSSHRKRKRAEDEGSKPSKRRKHAEPIWVRTNLTVRIVSKSFKDGRYYCKKARVLDVIGGEKNYCLLQLPDGKILDKVKQSALETAMPKVGGIVMVIRGKYKGTRGKVIERNSKKAVATVQLLPDLDVHKYDYDDICEYSSLGTDSRDEVDAMIL